MDAGPVRSRVTEGKDQNGTWHLRATAFILKGEQAHAFNRFDPREPGAVNPMRALSRVRKVASRPRRPKCQLPRGRGQGKRWEPRAD